MKPTKICSCTECQNKGRPQNASNFGRNSTSPDGLHWYCKKCNNEKQRAWKQANPEKVQEWKRRYVERVKLKNKNGKKPKQLELEL